MPRLMSFSMTADRIRDRSKTVTRRIGWYFLRPGDILWACEKCQGLGKGGKIRHLKVIEVVSVKKERLADMTKADCVLEGFPDMGPMAFVLMLMKHYDCKPDKIVNRIEFKYVDEKEIQEDGKRNL